MPESIYCICKGRIMDVFCNQLVNIDTMSIFMLKRLFLVLFNDHVSVHKSEKSKFIALIHKEYFHLGIFVIPMPNQKIWVPNHGIFFVFQCISGYSDLHSLSNEHSSNSFFVILQNSTLISITKS